MDDPRYHIDVQVSTDYLAQHSQPDEARYAFSYTVTLTNTGQCSAQLQSRHWVITDGNGRVQEVRGEGVIGQQPHIAPGASYTYSSGTVLNTQVGIMQGSYDMLAEDGKHFAAPIAPFRLAVPGSLH